MRQGFASRSDFISYNVWDLLIPEYYTLETAYSICNAIFNFFSELVATDVDMMTMEGEGKNRLITFYISKSYIDNYIHFKGYIQVFLHNQKHRLIYLLLSPRLHCFSKI